MVIPISEATQATQAAAALYSGKNIHVDLLIENGTLNKNEWVNMHNHYIWDIINLTTHKRFKDVVMSDTPEQEILGALDVKITSFYIDDVQKQKKIKVMVYAEARNNIGNGNWYFSKAWIQVLSEFGCLLTNKY